MIKHLEKNDNFEEITKARCLVDFYADWCGPCKMMGAALEEMESEIDIPIIKVNTDAHPDISAKFGIMSIPTLLVMENSQVIKKSIGFMPKEELKEFLKK